MSYKYTSRHICCPSCGNTDTLICSCQYKDILCKNCKYSWHVCPVKKRNVEYYGTGHFICEYCIHQEWSNSSWSDIEECICIIL